MKQPVKFVLLVGGVAASALLIANLLQAKAPFLKKAQEAGYADAKDCGYCHTKPKGGKEMNARGTWLKEKKAEKKATDVDVTWLKDYKEAEPAK